MKPMSSANGQMYDLARHLGGTAVLDDAVVVRGDCVELMAKLPPRCVDLTVTSPPYNIGKAYEDALTVEDYVRWSKTWLREVSRLTALDGAFWLNLGYFTVPGRGKAVPIPYLLWPHIDLFLIQEVIWNYGAGVAASKMFSPRNEKWLWFVNDQGRYHFDLDAVRDPDVKYPNQKKNGRLRVNPNGKNPSDVWQIPKVTTGADMTGQRASPERTKHPAQFPEEVIRRIILACSAPGDLILDPFGGSGTTAAVAIELGRRSLTFELDQTYIEISTERLRRRALLPATCQPELI